MKHKSHQTLNFSPFACNMCTRPRQTHLAEKETDASIDCTLTSHHTVTSELNSKYKLCSVQCKVQIAGHFVGKAGWMG